MAKKVSGGDDRKPVVIDSSLVRILVESTNTLLSEFKEQTQFCFAQGRLDTIPLHSVFLLNKLGYNPFQSKDRICMDLEKAKSSQIVTDLILSLRYLAEPGLSEKDMEKFYRGAMTALREFREELDSYGR